MCLNKLLRRVDGVLARHQADRQGWKDKQGHILLEDRQMGKRKYRLTYILLENETGIQGEISKWI